MSDVLVNVLQRKAGNYGFFSHGGDIQDLPFLLACTYICTFILWMYRYI